MLIEKNNSGKSKLLEALERFVKSGIQQYSDINLQIGKPFEEDGLNSVFRMDKSSDRIGDIFHDFSSSH